MSSLNRPTTFSDVFRNGFLGILASLAVGCGAFHDIGQFGPRSVSTDCGLSNPAFCDTFDQPYLGSGRTGQLDPSRWSVARLSGLNAPGSGMINMFPASDAMHCKT